MGHVSDISKWDIDPLPAVQRFGLIAIVAVASLSVLASVCLLSFLSFRMIFWRSNYSRYIGYNQYVVLIYNLVLADLLQSISFILSVRWVATKKIPASSPVCYAQGFLVQIGDPASGLFVFAISLHTFLLVTVRRKLRYRAFVACVVALWSLVILFAILPPALYGRDAFVPSGAWCWINSDYEPCRLWLHYIWIFISEFGAVCLYAVIVVQLRRRISESSILGTSHRQNLQRLRRVVGYMVLYPIAYVVLSLPLAAGRMATMRGNSPSVAYFCVAGAIMTSSGLVDVFLYALTRRKLLSDSESTNNRNNRNNNTHSNYNSSSKLAGAKNGQYGHNVDLSHHTVITTGSRGLATLSDTKADATVADEEIYNTSTAYGDMDDGFRFYDDEGGGNGGSGSGTSNNTTNRSSPCEGSMDGIVQKRDLDIELLPVGKVYQETTIEVTTEPAYPFSSNDDGTPRAALSGSLDDGSSFEDEREGRRIWRR